MATYWNKKENIEANKRGEVVPEQLRQVKKEMALTMVFILAALTFGVFMAVNGLSKYLGMSIFFIIVSIVTFFIAGSMFLSLLKIFRGSSRVIAIEGSARYEAARAGVRLYLDHEYVYCSNALTRKFKEGERYRIYIAEPSRLLLSAEKIS